MQAFQFKLKEKVLRIQPYEDQRKKFNLFQQKQVQQITSKSKLPDDFENSPSKISPTYPRAVRFSQQPIVKTFQFDIKSIVRETNEQVDSFSIPRLSKLDISTIKPEQSLIQSQSIEAPQFNIKRGMYSPKSEEIKQQELMIKKVKINQFFKSRPSSAEQKETKKVRPINSASNNINGLKSNKNKSISPNRINRSIQSSQKQLQEHQQKVQELKEQQRQYELAMLALKKKQPSFEEEFNSQNEFQYDNQEETHHDQDQQQNQEQQLQNQEQKQQNANQQISEDNQEKHDKESDIKNSNPELIKLDSNVFKIQHKLKFKPRLRPMSPQERVHNDTIKFLNTIKRPSSVDKEDNLHDLKTIYTSSKKNQIQPSIRKEVADTHSFAAQQKFRDIYKKVERCEEQIEIFNQEPTPIHAIIFKIHEQNKLPLKYGIVRERKNSKIIDASYQNIGDQSADIFCAGLSRLNQIDVLNLKHNCFTEKGIQQVIDSLKLDVKEIDFSNNQMTEANINSFLQKFTIESYYLQVLKLERVNLGDQSVDLLCTGLQYIKSLRIVNLSYNQISNRSCYSIEDMILNVYSLREIYLHWNKIQGEGGALILDACRENGRVRVLDLAQNQLGVSHNYDLFNNAFKKLCEADNENSITHLDFSFNCFRIQECLSISRSLKKNRSIMGFHFTGHDCYITSQGYVNQCYAKDLMHVKTIPIGDKRIDSCRFKGYNEYRLIQEKQGELPIRIGDNCWICEGWYEHTFEWTFKSGDLENIDLIYIHLEIDGYAPMRMNGENSNIGYFFFVRMVPPKSQIRYFFSLDGLTNTKIARDQPMSYEHEGIIVNFTSKDIDHSRKSFLFEDIINSQKDWAQRREKILSQMDVCNSSAGNKKKVEDLQQLLKDEEKAIKKEQDNVQYQVLGNLMLFEKVVKKQKKIELKTFNVLKTKKYFNIFTDKVNEQPEKDDKQSKQKTNKLNIITLPNTSNTSSNNDQYYIPLIKTRPRMYFQGREQIQLDTKTWDFQQSVFKEFKFEDEKYQQKNTFIQLKYFLIRQCLNFNEEEYIIDEQLIYNLKKQMLMKKCFEFDWECSRMNQIIRDQSDLAQVKEDLRSIYIYIRSCYKFLAAVGTIVDVPCIMMNTFTDFINKTNIIDNINLKLSDVDLKFVVSKSSSKFKRNPRNPEKGVIRYQFMEILVRLCEDKYIRHKITNKYSNALQLLLNEGYLSALKRYQICQNWRSSSLWNERCDFCFKYYSPVIKSVFKKYSDPGRKRQFLTFKYLSMDEFRNICHDADLISSRFTERDINAVFNLSMMTQIDEIKYDRHFQMGFPELLEAIARLSEKLIHEKLDSFIKEFEEKQMRGNAQKQQTTEAPEEEKKPQKRRQKRKNSSIVFSDEDLDNEEGSQELGKQGQFFQGIQLYHKIESLLYALYRKCVEDDLKDSFSFPAQTIFTEIQKDDLNSKKKSI